MRVTQKELENHVLCFYMMLKSVRNTDNADLSSLFHQRLKMEYSTMNKSIERFLSLFKETYTKETLEILDDKSYAFLDLISLMRDKKNAKHTETLFEMMSEFLQGKAHINLDDGQKVALPYCYETPDGIFRPDQLIGKYLTQFKPLYI